MKHKLNLGKAFKNASPMILTCLGALGVFATAALAVKATPKAVKLIQADSREKHDGDSTAATPVEMVQSAWKCYIPAALTGAATVICIFGANTLNRRQQASLTSAYAILNRTYTDYRNKVREVYGEEADQEIIRKIVTEKPVPPCIIGTMSGRSFDLEGLTEEPRVFFDSLSERFFEATPQQVLQAEYHTNRNFALNGGEISVEEFYDFLGLDTPERLQGLSWFVCDYYTWIDFSHTKSILDDGPDGETECWIITMDTPPTPELIED